MPCLVRNLAFCVVMSVAWHGPTPIVSSLRRAFPVQSMHAYVGAGPRRPGHARSGGGGHTGVHPTDSFCARLPLEPTVNLAPRGPND
jgi:hypothetical protein